MANNYTIKDTYLTINLINISFYSYTGLDQQFITILGLEDRVAWLWAALIVFGAPEVGVFLRSARIAFFKTVQKPTAGPFFAVSTYI